MIKSTMSGVLQLFSWEPGEDCILGLGLAVSPAGVSRVTSQAAGREPYDKRGGTRTYQSLQLAHAAEGK